MPRIIPINELKNTANISKFIEECDEPVFVTKNGYGSMVLMSIEVYEREIAKNQVVKMINDSLKDIDNDDLKTDGSMFISEMKSKYGKKL